MELNKVCEINEAILQTDLKHLNKIEIRKQNHEVFKSESLFTPISFSTPV